MAGRAITVSRSTQDAPSGGSNFKLIHYRRVAALFSGLIFGLCWKAQSLTGSDHD